MNSITQRMENLREVLLKDGFIKDTEEQGEIFTAESYVKQLIPLEDADVNQITSIIIILLSNGNVLYEFGVKKISDTIFDILFTNKDFDNATISIEETVPVFTGWIQSIEVMESIYNACFQKIISMEETSLRQYIERTVITLTSEIKNNLEGMDRISIGECLHSIRQEIEEYCTQQENEKNIDDSNGKILQFPENNILH